MVRLLAVLASLTLFKAGLEVLLAQELLQVIPAEREPAG